MSIQTLKKHGVARYGTKISGRAPGGLWPSQAPYNPYSMFSKFQEAPGGVGFSINGGRRNVGYVGQSREMSKSGTPYQGQFPKGSGGCCGTYYNGAQPVFNAARAETLGDQYSYVKPSVVSTKAMLEKRFNCIFHGQYPRVWVSPNTGNSNLAENASQQIYIDKKAAANTTVTDTNKPQVYAGYRTCGAGPRGGAKCSNTPSSAKYTFSKIDSQHGYSKNLYQPQTSQQHMRQLQQKCSNPTGVQKPFPFATRNVVNSTSVYRPARINTPNNPIKNVVYYSPPDWYTSDKVCKENK